MRGAEQNVQPVLPGPGGPYATAIQVERRQADFRIGVAGEMRFGQEKQTRYAAGRRKRVPHALADDVQIKLRNDLVADPA